VKIPVRLRRGKPTSKDESI